jgi:hypothetical protein
LNAATRLTWAEVEEETSLRVAIKDALRAHPGHDLLVCLVRLIAMAERAPAVVRQRFLPEGLR